MAEGTKTRRTKRTSARRTKTRTAEDRQTRDTNRTTARRGGTRRVKREVVASGSSDTTAQVVSGPRDLHPSELEPERRPMEIDVADIKNPDKVYEGEYSPPLNAESWVILGKHDLVPEWAEGRVAAVIDAPVAREVDDATGSVREYLHENAVVTVKERSQGAIFYLPLKAFSKISRAGRPPIVGYA